jgi:hypothetical protein
MSSQNILLDPDIRDWVVLPLFVVMVTTGLLRVHVGNLLKPAPKNTTKVVQRSAAAVRSTSALKSGAVHFLGTSRLEARRIAYPEILRDQADWCEAFLEEEEQARKDNDDDDDLPNPLAQMDGMAGNMVGMVRPQGRKICGGSAWCRHVTCASCICVDRIRMVHSLTRTAAFRSPFPFLTFVLP